MILFKNSIKSNSYGMLLGGGYCRKILVKHCFTSKAFNARSLYTVAHCSHCSETIMLKTITKVGNSQGLIFDTAICELTGL